MTHIFVSYVEHDGMFAQHLKRQLQVEGFTVWMDDPEDDLTGEHWATIEASIFSASAYLVVMSSNAQKSPRIRRELQMAHEFDKPIFPVLFWGKPWAQVADMEYFDMTTGTDSALPLRLVSRLVDVVPIRRTGGAVPYFDADLAEAEKTTHSAAKGRFPINKWMAVAGFLAIIGFIGVSLPLLDLTSDPSESDGSLAPRSPSAQVVSGGTRSNNEAQSEIDPVQTQAALTAIAIATFGTATPTIDYRGTVDARFTATRMAADAQSEQSALVQSATAAVETVIVTLSPTVATPLTRLATSSQVVTTVPTQSTTSISSSRDSPTPMPLALEPTETIGPAEAPTPTSDEIVPNGWNAGTYLYVQETVGVSEYAGQEPNRPEQFQPGDEVIVGLGNIAPGRYREWYVVQATQERWWFVDHLGGGWLPEYVLAELPPAPTTDPLTEQGDEDDS